MNLLHTLLLTTSLIPTLSYTMEEEEPSKFQKLQMTYEVAEGELARLELMLQGDPTDKDNKVYNGVRALLDKNALSIPDLNERALALAKAMGKENLIKQIEDAAARGRNGDVTLLPDEVIRDEVFKHAYKDREGKVNDLKTLRSINETDKRFHKLSEGDREAYKAQEIARMFKVDIQSRTIFSEAIQPFINGVDIVSVSPMANEKENVTNEWVKILCEKYPHMHGLNLQGCTQVTDITPLSSLQNLFELALGGTNITDLSPLLELPNLLGLSVNTNIISNQKIREFQEAYEAKYGRRVEMPHNYQRD